MAVFKCESCGGNLDVINNGGSRVLECPYCGTQQTVPQTDDEKKINIYNRATKLRMQCEFDKAEGIYETIVTSYPDDAEAYWGLCLCKYGIEYVDDPGTDKKIPTCHRTLTECILDDDDFSQVLENSDADMKEMYREKAKEIDRIQQSILEVAAQEEPYDIFICYKETDEDGERTDDSVIAQEIYDKLIEKDYKVFFARITLEDKFGKEYEPYIFSALCSSKVMLVIGSKYEYFDAVWVKNEWQRFLELKKTDAEKVLIPCYRDIDAYDMPREFKNLQSVNLAAVGSIQDLVRNVGKIISPEQKAPVVSPAGVSIDSLMMRAEDFLADRNWDEAGNYSEKVLDMNPRYAKAYLTNLMSQLRISKINHIDEYYLDIRNNPNYRKFMDYADEKLKRELAPHFEKAEISRKVHVYAKAEELARSTNMGNVADAIELFASIKDWNDANQQMINCRRKITNYHLDKSHKELDTAKKNLKKSKNVFKLFPTAFMLLIIIVGVLALLIGGALASTENNAVYDSAMVCMLVGTLAAFIGGTISTMMLFKWSSILSFFGAYFINGFTCGILGVVAAIVNFVKTLVARNRDVKEKRLIVEGITLKIEDYKKALENLK